MFKRLFTLEWNAFFRSASVGKSIGVKILMIFLALYFTIIFLLAGIGLYPLIQKYLPGRDPLNVANDFVLLWLVAELALRFFLQAIPVLNIKPLLLLPIRKRILVDFLLVKSVFSFFNFLPLLILIPFGIFNLYQGLHSNFSIIAWMFAIMSLSLSMNFANFIIKRRFTDGMKTLLPGMGVLLVFTLLEYFDIFKFTLFFGEGLNLIIRYPWMTLIPLALLISLFIWNRHSLETRFYLDGSLKERTENVSTQEFLWTKRFGDLAPFLQQDLKLIWRNKRPKTAVYISLLLLGYGLLFYPQFNIAETPYLFVLVGVFMTGSFMMNFGQFFPAWDAGYYSMLMSQDIPLFKYLMAKAGIITVSVVTLTILSTPYLYFGWLAFLLNIVCAVYNIGINIPILLYAGSFNKKRIDLDQGSLMNYQGTGVAQWLIGIPLLTIPVILFWALHKFISFESAMGGLLGLGILGLISKSHLISLISQVYKRKKYAMIEGFKQEGSNN